MLSNFIFELLPDIEKIKTRRILRSSKILITMGETHREKINKKIENWKIKIKTGQILRSSKILITMGETHREKINKKIEMEN